MSIADLARPEIRALNPYEAAAQVADTIRLNANEAPWNPAGDRFRRPLNRYPEIRPARLRDALAKRYGCRPGELLVTRGSSEAIDLLIRVFCRPGVDNIVTTTPGFSMYRHYAAIQGAVVREVRTSADADFRVDPDALLEACDAATRLIFLCSPNNPTGTVLDTGVLEHVLDARAGKSAVVLDEAYIEFSGERSAAGLVDRYDNLIVLRTLSKAIGFAGARCGAVIGRPEIVDMLNAVQAPYALATPVVECVEDALETAAEAAAKRAIETIVAERRRVAGALERLSCVRRIWPSAANFFLVDVERIGALLELAAQEKILLRQFPDSLPGCLRITVGTEAENDRLLGMFERHEGAHDGD